MSSSLKLGSSDESIIKFISRMNVLTFKSVISSFSFRALLSFLNPFSFYSMV
eukprot:NODE_1469_length_1153_cov_139.805254_g1202_i0.p1 GENE.NODE_1469_length_1153_cov_139.805254_g1202_i0~~NODE_1469_length_1153_cov_139.805254_g1202_i0.p1  ORF type:complete len:52 (-),score=3.01 NODE_1469_length_1153_cov_139.805254_g1202_i0:838-993(-)